MRPFASLASFAATIPFFLTTSTALPLPIELHGDTAERRVNRNPPSLKRVLFLFLALRTPSTLNQIDKSLQTRPGIRASAARRHFIRMARQDRGWPDQVVNCKRGLLRSSHKSVTDVDNGQFSAIEAIHHGLHFLNQPGIAR